MNSIALAAGSLAGGLESAYPNTRRGKCVLVGGNLDIRWLTLSVLSQLPVTRIFCIFAASQKAAHEMGASCWPKLTVWPVLRSRRRPPDLEAPPPKSLVPSLTNLCVSILHGTYLAPRTAQRRCIKSDAALWNGVAILLHLPYSQLLIPGSARQIVGGGTKGHCRNAIGGRRRDLKDAHLAHESWRRRGLASKSLGSIRATSRLSVKRNFKNVPTLSSALPFLPVSLAPTAATSKCVCPADKVDPHAPDSTAFALGGV